MVYLATKCDIFNNTNDNSFNKDIPEADSKKIIQHVKLKKKYAWRIHELCVENVWKKRHSKS